MDSTPSPSSSSAFDLVSRALGRYIPRGGAATPVGTAQAQGDRTRLRPPENPAAGRQEQILGALNLDPDLIITRCNLEAPVFAGLEAGAGKPFVDLLPPGDVPTVTRRLRQVIESGEAHVARIQRLRRGDGSELVVSMSILPAAAPEEGLTVSVIAMARRLHLYAAETAIGTSLDIGETAQSLAESLLAWGDVAAVDLDFAVWTGEGVTGKAQGRIHLRRAALVPDRVWPEGYMTPGDDLPGDASRLLAQAVLRDDAPQTIVIPDREALERVFGSPRVVRALVPGDRSAGLACIPLVLDGAPPTVLGVAEVWRRADCPFGDGELFDLQELVARTAHHVDLARQHQREHTQVLALQRRLLPRAGGDTIEIASVYQPATPDSAGVGGDWVNSFPLPDGRTALVVGDVVGHGLGAAATMGQLSMEARALLSAGLAPDQVLEHLDETVTLLDDAESGLAAGYSALGSTCCIALYDPVGHHVTLSSAGHLPPILVSPDGRAAPLSIRPHPGLGAEFALREPFDVYTFGVPPGSVLALYTDGLVEDRALSIDEGIDRLADIVSKVHPWDALQQSARQIVSTLAPAPQRDDVTLLLARMIGYRKEDTATWRLPARGDAPARARAQVAALLMRWGTRDDTRDNALLLVSELVTNAVRFAEGPITVRLIRAGHALLCEVGDSGNGRPRLRRGDLLDNGGRGLSIVHRLTTRWGVRWTDTGKVVWAEIAR
ncbi:serine phosphatase RsbU (regulator of sigma subunit)/anti-sigma regulatory factor (Ser/Thr protein kinase) [Streptomyces luteogriseus]|uniref:ATP-binding SpoIIE family protein phosphatase n=1 Tax=Streptomyces luteogriseus TaxID=68233 RepID=UPI00278A4E23|nr:SpoIIE family protein phosphatase [Streptomyces luteogriseus]MDQ0710871.1 serine phosphatase RsbU (regulator of sigma subunit)/anti-sigma regulatory factor (Ser/Thr protein kinase) [Streptomyces luteogriseus]